MPNPHRISAIWARGGAEPVRYRPVETEPIGGGGVVEHRPCPVGGGGTPDVAGVGLVEHPSRAVWGWWNTGRHSRVETDRAPLRPRCLSKPAWAHYKPYLYFDVATWHSATSYINPSHPPLWRV